MSERFHQPLEFLEDQRLSIIGLYFISSWFSLSTGSNGFTQLLPSLPVILLQTKKSRCCCYNFNYPLRIVCPILLTGIQIVKEIIAKSNCIFQHSKDKFTQANFIPTIPNDFCAPSKPSCKMYQEYLYSWQLDQASHALFSNYANSENSSIESGSGSWEFYVKHSLSVNDNYQSSILQMGTCTNHFQNNYCKSCNSVLSLYI